MEGPRGREVSSKAESEAVEPQGRIYTGSETTDKPSLGEGKQCPNNFGLTVALQQPGSKTEPATPRQQRLMASGTPQSSEVTGKMEEVRERMRKVKEGRDEIRGRMEEVRKGMEEVTEGMQ